MPLNSINMPQSSQSVFHLQASVTRNTPAFSTEKNSTPDLISNSDFIHCFKDVLPGCSEEKEITWLKKIQTRLQGDDAADSIDALIELKNSVKKECQNDFSVRIIECSEDFTEMDDLIFTFIFTYQDRKLKTMERLCFYFFNKIVESNAFRIDDYFDNTNSDVLETQNVSTMGAHIAGQAEVNNITVSERSNDLKIIPKKIHYIWEGGDISLGEMKNILSCKRLNPDYQVNIYTTRPMSIISTVEKMLSSENNAADRYLAHKFFAEINLRDTHELYKNIADDIEIKEEGLFLSAMWGRETNGVYKNYAAASDITRAVLMYLEGGIYMDVDIAIKAPFGDIDAKQGFLIEPTRQVAGNIFITNAILASTKKSPIARQLLTGIMTSLKANERAAQNRIEFDDLSQSEKIYHNSLWSTKRSGNIESAYQPNMQYHRFYGTMMTTGPLALLQFISKQEVRNAVGDISHPLFHRMHNNPISINAGEISVAKIMEHGLSCGKDFSIEWSYIHPGRRSSIG